MIQFRWRKAKTSSHAEDQGNGTLTAVTEPVESGAVRVDREWCVLQYRLHFVPTEIVGEEGEEFIVLKQGRECDTQWTDVTVDSDQ